MSEDLPMRNRKGALRKVGHNFFSPKATYPFNYSEKIGNSNVYLKQDVSNQIEINKTDIFKSKNGESIGEKLGVLSFFVSVNDEKINLWPSTCSHEGAQLSISCIKGERIFCPWHNRIAKPILSIGKNQNNLEINNSKDYEILDSEKKIKIIYKNINKN